jgi:hypothetical protein
MNWVWRAKVLWIFWAAACAYGQMPLPPPPEGDGRLLSLGSPMLRSTMDRINLPWLIPEKMPEFRLKVERSATIPLSPAEMQGRLRGVEIQLPMKGLWVGYETPIEGDDPRATFSIQRSF